MTPEKTQGINRKTLLDLFRQEGIKYCEAMVAGLLELEQKPEKQRTLEALLRAAHSLKGASRIVEYDAIACLAHNIEDVFSTAQKSQESLSREAIDRLLAAADLLKEMVLLHPEEMEAWMRRENARLQGISDMVAELANLSPSPPPPPRATPPPTLEEKTGKRSTDRSDPSLLGLFSKEALSFCELLSNGLLALEANPVGDGQTLATMMRAAHSIKGAARVVALDQVVRIAHAMEDVFSTAQEGRLIFSRENIDILLKGLDFITTIARDPSRSASKSGAREATPLEAALRKLAKQGWCAEEQSRPVAGLKTIQQTTTRSAEEKEDRDLRVSTEAMNRLLGLVGEVQIENRWLPSLTLRMLRLKFRQDELNRIADRAWEGLELGSSRESIRLIMNDLRDKLQTCRQMTLDSLGDADDHAIKSNSLSHRLYREVLANRMCAFGEGVRGFPRLVRDLGRELGKDIRFEITGEDTRVDRDILERIEAPLNHILRNAIDHGIEVPEERTSSGKASCAILKLSAVHASGMLQVTVSDDGRGVDLEKVRRRIIERKMTTPDVARQLEESELLEFLFLPNFTTRESVSVVSGRGVGLDVVREAVHSVRGAVRVSSRHGLGTTFELHLPLTLSVMRALLVSVAGEPYAFPLVHIDHVFKVGRNDIREVEGRQYFTFNEKRIGFVSARQILEKGEPDDKCEEYCIVAVSDRQLQYGVVVDDFIGIRDLVVQPLDKRLGKIKDISSAAILEDGSPVLIVDIQDLVRSMDALISGSILHRLGSVTEETAKRVKRILVVDDSITVREVERKMLAQQGYRVDTAVDGMEAWNILRSREYDLVVTDIDMPRMDGVELIRQVREDSRLAHIPMVIVSYKDRDEDRAKGLEAGADYYLTKGSFQDETLVEAVQELIGAPFE